MDEWWGKKPLLVTGARQVGKTFLIKDIFAERYYKDKYLRIDCSDDEEFVNYVNLFNGGIMAQKRYKLLHFYSWRKVIWGIWGIILGILLFESLIRKHIVFIILQKWTIEVSFKKASIHIDFYFYPL